LPRSLPQRGSLGAGFFDPVNPTSVQVLGRGGAGYLERLAVADRNALPKALRRKGLSVLIAAGRAGALSAAWDAAGITVLHSSLAAHELVYRLRRELAEAQATHTLRHGVLMRVHGLGVLLTAPAGSGKSALALELLNRGHALVADDAVEIRRLAPSVLIGYCPEVLRGYLEVRGLGVLDIRGMHGERAVSGPCMLDLAVRLTPGRSPALSARERLGGRRGRLRVLGESVPLLSLPSQLGHNLAALVEAACLDQRLRLSGLSGETAFQARQKRAVQQQQ
jgi:HPr kinase/phosphorylase